MKKEYISVPKMKSIFYDFNLLPKGLVKNYYLLAVDLIDIYEIQERSVIFKELRSSIEQMLNEQQKSYVTARYGFLDGNIRTLAEIGKKYHVTRERVRQVLSDAYRILQGAKIKFYIPSKIEYLTTKKCEIEDELARYTEVINNPGPVEITIHDFGFSTRAFNALSQNNIITYEQLRSLTPKKLMRMKNLGIKTVDEIWFTLYGNHIDIVDILD